MSRQDSQPSRQEVLEVRLLTHIVCASMWLAHGVLHGPGCSLMSFLKGLPRRGLLLCCAICLQVAINLPGGTFFSSKETILNRITAILAAYRKYCATSSSAVRLLSQFKLVLELTTLDSRSTGRRSPVCACRLSSLRQLSIDDLLELPRPACIHCWC
jgi:hypothetical protein